MQLFLDLYIVYSSLPVNICKCNSQEINLQIIKV